MIRLSALDNILQHPEVAQLSPQEVEGALRGHEFLREILGMLKEDIQVFLSGIQRDKTMADKLMYIPNDDSQNYPFYRFN